METLSNSDLINTLPFSSSSSDNSPFLEAPFSDSCSNYNIPLFCFISKTPCFINSCGSIYTNKVFLSSPYDSTIMVELFYIRFTGCIPCISNIFIHTLFVLICFLGFFIHLYHLCGFTIRHISTTRTYLARQIYYIKFSSCNI